MPGFVAAGCLRSTANNLLLLLEAFMNYKTSPLASAMQEMVSPRRPGPGFQQALGWWVVSFGAADPGFIFHGGQTPGFSSAVAFDPRTRTGVVVLSNDTSRGIDRKGWWQTGFRSRPSVLCAAHFVSGGECVAGHRCSRGQGT
jgi:CubicO group peptidase (beta-lactamase class C family)